MNTVWEKGAGALFVRRAREAGAEVNGLATDQLAAWAASLMESRAPWYAEPDLASKLELDTHQRAESERARVAFAEAHACIAETGTVVLASEATARAHFLPEIHVVIAHPNTLVDNSHQGFSAALARVPNAATVSMVTGPSRTADVEQTLQVGAHGPIRLVVVCLG